MAELPTDLFLHALVEGEEQEIELENGRDFLVKLVSLGSPNDEGIRQVPNPNLTKHNPNPNLTPTWP